MIKESHNIIVDSQDKQLIEGNIRIFKENNIDKDNMIQKHNSDIVRNIFALQVLLHLRVVIVEAVIKNIMIINKVKIENIVVVNIKMKKQIMIEIMRDKHILEEIELINHIIKKIIRIISKYHIIDIKV